MTYSLDFVVQMVSMAYAEGFKAAAETLKNIQPKEQEMAEAFRAKLLAASEPRHVAP